MKRAPNKTTVKMRGRALVAALAYIKRGLAPVPVEPRDKAGVAGWDIRRAPD
jgi:hypothetical protein